MLFIYWGWDTSVSVNEETKDSDKTPGRAAVLSTLILLVTYAIVVMASQSYAGVGSKGIGLGNPANSGDVLSVLGTAIFGSSGFGNGPDPPAVVDGAQFGGRVHADHHSADRPDHIVDGHVQGDSVRIRPDPQAVLDAHRLDARHGRRVDRHLRGDEHPVVGQQRHRRLGLGVGRDDRLLLRADRVRLFLVLPQEPHRERPEPVAPWRPARFSGALILLGCHGLQLLALLESGQQLHHLDAALLAPLADRWRLHSRRRHAADRHHSDVRLQGVPPGLLPGRGAQPRHADPGPRRDRSPRRPVRDRALRRAEAT